MQDVWIDFNEIISAKRWNAMNHKQIEVRHKRFIWQLFENLPFHTYQSIWGIPRKGIRLTEKGIRRTCLKVMFSGPKFCNRPIRRVGLYTGKYGNSPLYGECSQYWNDDLKQLWIHCASQTLIISPFIVRASNWASHTFGANDHFLSWEPS